MTQNVSETLNRAADLIEGRGWARGSRAWGDLDLSGATVAAGPLCLEGAISAATDIRALGDGRETEFMTCPAYLAVDAYLGERLSRRQREDGIYCYNDAPRRTAEEVIETLRAAAVIAEAREQADLIAAAAEVAVTVVTV